MAKATRFVALGLILLVVMISKCSKNPNGPSSSPPPPPILLISPEEGPPGTMISAWTDLDSVSPQCMYIRIDTVCVPIISSGRSSFSFIVPIMPPGATEVTLMLSDGRASNSPAFTVAETRPSGLPPGEVTRGCATVVEDLVVTLRDFASVLADSGHITPAETLSISRNLELISVMLSAVKQEIASLPDSEKCAIDGLFKESGLSDLFGVTGSTGGLGKEVSDLRSLLRTQGEFSDFYCLIICDNISFTLSAMKAAVTMVGVVAIASGVGAAASAPLIALGLAISTFDHFIDGWWPTDLYTLDVKFIPTDGPTLQVGETAKGDFQGYFRTQSDPTSSSIELYTEAILTTMGVVLAKSKIDRIVAKIGTMVGKSVTEELVKDDPIFLSHPVPVDIRYYDMSFLQIMDLTSPYMAGEFSFLSVEKLLSSCGVQVPALVTDPVELRSDLATYDLASNTLMALKTGTIAAEEIQMNCWVMNPICEGEKAWWWSWICLGIELPEALADSDYDVTGITIVDEALFRDDFTDGAKSEWNIEGSRWSFSEGVARTSIPTTYINEFMYVGDHTWEDYTFEVDVEGTQGTDKMVAFRFQDRDHWYCIHLIGPIQYQDLEIGKSEAGTPYQILASKKPFSVQNGVTYHLKVEVRGSTIKLWVNGILELQATDTMYSSGGVALVGHSGGYVPCSVVFDNVVVTEIGD